MAPVPEFVVAEFAVPETPVTETTVSETAVERPVKAMPKAESLAAEKVPTTEEALAAKRAATETMPPEASSFDATNLNRP